MDVIFLITTYNRQESCQRLIDSLQRLGDVLVISDGCFYPLAGCKRIFQQEHNGREGYYKTVFSLWEAVGYYNYYFMLPDDFMPIEGMVDGAVRTWNGISDPQKICLNLYADRIGVPCWTGFTPVDKGNVWQTQWVDLCFMAERKFFDEMVSFVRINKPDNFPAHRSSGVGAYVSRTLHKKGFHLYQVKESLVYPQEEHGKSQMHSAYSEPARKRKRVIPRNRIFGKPGR